MPKTKASSQRKQKSKFIPYATGFKPPSPNEQRLAISPKKTLPKELLPEESFFTPVPPPTSIDDWLAQYNEEGQTFHEFIDDNPWISCRKRKNMKGTFVARGLSLPEKYPGGKIYLLPLGDFDCDTAPSFDILVEYAQAFFCLPVEVLPGIPLQCDDDSNVYWVEHRQNKGSSRSRKMTRPQKFHLDSRHNVETGKRQLQVNSILVNLKRSIPQDALCLIALTMDDLYQAQNDLFVAGMAAGNHRVAVFSFYRYDPSMDFSIDYWWNTEKNIKVKQEDRMKMIIQRSCKLLVHEVSHILGLDHCIFFSCCMNGSGHLKEDFSQSMHLCPVDLHKLQFLCGFRVLERYKKLLEFFKKFDLAEESDWMTRRVEYLEDKQSDAV